MYVEGREGVSDYIFNIFTILGTNFIVWKNIKFSQKKN